MNCFFYQFVCVFANKLLKDINKQKPCCNTWKGETLQRETTALRRKEKKQKTFYFNKMQQNE